MEQDGVNDPRHFSDPREALITISAEADDFMIDGKRYFLVRDPKKLPMARYIEFDRKCIEFSFKGDYGFITSTITTAMRQCTAENFQMAFVTLFNLMHGMTDAEVAAPIAVQFCTLFIIREDEDITVYDPVINKAKVTDWRKIEMGFFLDYTNRMLSNYSEILEAISRIYSEAPRNVAMTNQRRESLQNSLITPSPDS